MPPCFQIILKNEKTKQYDRIALLIILINLAIFIFLGLTATAFETKISYLSVAVLIIIILGIEGFLHKIKMHKESPYKFFAEFVILLAWLQTQLWWIAIIIAILGIFYQQVKKPLVVNASEKNIIYPSIPKKTILWSSLNNVRLKDGILTIDCKNNKLIQQHIDENMISVNEKDFNDFCRAHLSK